MSFMALIVNSGRCCNVLMKHTSTECKNFLQILNKQPRLWSLLKHFVPDEKALGRPFFEMNQQGDEVKIFKGVSDRYHGITVVSNDEPCTGLDFPTLLIESLNRWKISKVRGVWFKVFLDHADWVPILAENGFRFHHAKQEYVMMCKWLPSSGDECNIPHYAHTMVGVGAVVVNSKNEILVVREKYYENPHWKLPGGYVEPGEDIVDAVIREVNEETAVNTKFHSIVAFRHTHGIQFSCSDLYFIASLIPMNEEIVKCDREIVACQWMKIEDFLNHPHVHETNRQFVSTFLNYRSNGIQIIFEKNKHPVIKRPQSIFTASLTSNDTAVNISQDTHVSKTQDAASLS